MKYKMNIYVSKCHINEKFSIENFMKVHEEISNVDKIILKFFSENGVDIRCWKSKKFVIIVGELISLYITEKKYKHYENAISMMNRIVEKHIMLYSKFPFNNINKWFSYRQQQSIESMILDVIAEVM